jgi:transcriptional regulator with XRE-family HTH domain
MATRDLIAKNLRTLRDLRGLSQLELAQRVGVSRRTVARLEAAEIADPGIDQIRDMARVLGVTVEMLCEQKLVPLELPVPEDLRDLLTGENAAPVLAAMHRAGKASSS